MNNSRITNPGSNGKNHTGDVPAETAHHNGNGSDRSKLSFTDTTSDFALAGDQREAEVLQNLVGSNGSQKNGVEYGLVSTAAAPLVPAADALVDVEEEVFGGTLSSKNTYTILRTHIPCPEINEKFVLAVAYSGDEKGFEKVHSHHTSIYLRSHGAHLTVLKHIEANIARHVRGVQNHVKELSRSLGSTLRDHDIFRKNEPWSAFDVCRALIYAVLMFLCIGAGTNTLAQTMVASYVPGFGNYGRDLLFSFLVVCCPVVIECFVQHTFTQTGKRIMVAVLCLLTLGSFGVWVWSFSQTFQIGGTSAAAIANDLAHSLAGNAGQPINTLTISQIISEVLVAAIIAIALEHLYVSHRLSERFTNPQFAKTEKDLGARLRLLREEEELLGHARGRIFEIEHELKEFVENACELYKAHRMTVQQHQNIVARLTK